MVESLLWIALFAYATFVFVSVHVRLRRITKSPDWFTVKIPLEDIEEIFFDGRERIYETPHGLLHVFPDSEHVYPKAKGGSAIRIDTAAEAFDKAFPRFIYDT